MAKSRFKKGGINLTAILCAVIIAVSGVLVTLIGVGSSWFTNPVIASWFGSWGKDKEPPETYELIVPQEAGCMVLSSTKTKSSPVALSGAYTSGAKSCTLTATLEPADAYYSSVTWTAGEHIELTQDESNPLTVTVKLNGELFFTEQITVEIVSLKTLTATCNVDYLAYPDSVAANVTPNTQFFKCGGETYTVSGDFNFGTTAGTIHDFDCVITDWAIELTSETISAISSELGINTGWDYAWEFDGTTITLGATPYDMFCDTSVETKDNFNRAFFKVCNGRNDVIQLRLNCEVVYNGTVCKYLSDETLFGIDSASYAIGLEGVNIDDIIITG